MGTIESLSQRNRTWGFLFAEHQMRLVIFLAVLWISLLPAFAEEPKVQLRGLDQSVTDSPKPDGVSTVDDTPIFSGASKSRIVPADPGVIPQKSRLLKLPVDKMLEDRLTISSTPPKFLVPIGKERLPPLKLEAKYSEPISLKDALTIARDNNLPIQIAKTDVSESKYKLIGSLSGFVPSMSMNYTPQTLYSGNKTLKSDPYFITMIYPVFLGGGAVFNSLSRLHEMRAARNTLLVSNNDVLLDAYVKYYDLMLNWALLALRSKSLEVAQTLLSINQDLMTAGLGTDFEVMQAKTLLALEKQRMVRQEVELRRSALQLCVTLNKSVLVNLVPSEGDITRQSLVEEDQSPEFLTALAVQHRPELARWEELRLAARDAAVAAASPLVPRAAFFTNNSINIGGSGSSIIIPTGGGSGSGGITSETTGSANSAFAGGFILNWLLAGGGLNDAGNSLAARMKARKALLEGKEELLKVSAQVRQAYNDTRAADTEIEVTTEAVGAAAEQLRMANLRLTHQVGINLEVVQAERDYIDAVSRRIEAFVNFKKSQARLLHATGLISVQTLTCDRAQRFQLRKGK